MASLYDDINSKVSGGPTPEANKINLTFLKSQLEAKKAILQNSQKLSSLSQISIQKSEPNIHDVDEQKPKSLLSLKPRRALPLPIDSTSTFTIVPKALKEDKVFLFGEVLVEDEYNPTAPTDYAAYKQKREAQKVKEKVAKEIAERLSKQHEEEQAKRRAGAAIAPPQALLEEAPTTSTQNENFESPAQFGKAGSRGLGVAANIMQKLGYKEGSGLGRMGQGISQALKVERTGKNQGLIVNNDERESFRENPGFSSADEQNPNEVRDEKPQQGITEMLKMATKIVLLRNMAHPSDVDSDLETEIREEMKKYGQLNNVIVHQLPNMPDEEAVRIFLEFSNSAQAIKAIIDLNGRYFAGRPIRASFYQLDEYSQRKLDTEIKFLT